MKKRLVNEKRVRVLKQGKVGETYNIGGNNERTNLELVSTICRIIRPHVQGDPASLITFVADRPGHDRRYAINASKIEKDLNWSPSVTFDAGFEKTVSWYLENKWWWEPLLSDPSFGTRLGDGG